MLFGVLQETNNNLLLFFKFVI